MDFDSNRSTTLSALRDFREAMLLWDRREITLDLSGLQEISPAAAVVLVAEMKRCVKYLERARKVVRAIWPKPGTAADEVFVGLGLVRYLVPDSRHPSTLPERKRWWFQIRDGHVTDAKKLGELMEHYRRHLPIDDAWARRFHEGLLEVANNVPQHAYKEWMDGAWLWNHWWLAGIVDQDTGSIDFVFWDQGVGIPATMRRRGLPFLAPTDAELIEAASRLGGTSTGQTERRGRGLPLLLDLIEASPGGTLLIASGKGTLACQKGNARVPSTHTEPLEGTLVSWTMRTDDISAKAPR